MSPIGGGQTRQQMGQACVGRMQCELLVPVVGVEEPLLQPERGDGAAAPVISATPSRPVVIEPPTPIEQPYQRLELYDRGEARSQASSLARTNAATASRTSSGKPDSPGVSLLSSRM